MQYEAMSAKVGPDWVAEWPNYDWYLAGTKRDFRSCF
jgi:hypothetical protein